MPGWKIGCKQFGIADQGEIRFQLWLLFADIFGDRFSPDLLFAFDDELHIDRQLSTMPLHQRLDRFYFHPELALVVYRTARVDVVVTLSWFEGRRNPLIQRIRRLHVIVRVAKHRRLARSMQPVGINQRVALSWDHLDVFHSNAPQFARHIVRRSQHVGFVLGKRADAGNAQEILQFIQEALLIVARVINCGGSHGGSSLVIASIAGIATGKRFSIAEADSRERPGRERQFYGLRTVVSELS